MGLKMIAHMIKLTKTVVFCLLLLWLTGCTEHMNRGFYEGLVESNQRDNLSDDHILPDDVPNYYEYKHERNETLKGEAK